MVSEFVVLLIFRIARGAVAAVRIRHIARIDHALDMFQIIVQSIEHEHERTVSDEVAGPAVPSLAEEMVEPAAPLLLDEVRFFSLNLRIIDIHRTSIY